MLRTTNPTAGADSGGFYLLAHFDNKDPEQVREMLEVKLADEMGRVEVEEYDDNHVLLKIYIDIDWV